LVIQNTHSTDKNRMQHLKVQCCSTFMTKAADSYRMLVPAYQNTWLHIPKTVPSILLCMTNSNFMH